MTDLKTTFPNATVIDGINQSSATITTQIHESFDNGNRITILELPLKEVRVLRKLNYGTR